MGWFSAVPGYNWRKGDRRNILEEQSLEGQSHVFGYPELPQDMNDLMERIQREWAAFYQTCGHLDEEALNRRLAGGWTVIDHLLHITSWEDILVRYHLSGEAGADFLDLPADMLERWNTNEINQALREKWQGTGVAEAAQVFYSTHERVVEKLDEMGFEALVKPKTAGGGLQETLLQAVIENTYAHYMEHYLTLQSEIRRLKLDR
jgi:hypothetical protein